MSVWLTIPSARPVAEVNARMNKWRAMGYKIALWRDEAEGGLKSDLLRFGDYPGYARAVNALAAVVFGSDSACDWIVAAGDDTDPDPTKRADDIARECSVYFGFDEDDPGDPEPYVSSFGVMQPTGDPWSDSMGRIIERIAGSPWLGREWCRRANRGQGPFWPEFRHMFGDEHLRAYAMSLGVYWERPDLTHYHDHAQRPDARGFQGPPAPHMAQWNTQEHWRESQTIFERLKAGKFQECAPL